MYNGNLLRCQAGIDRHCGEPPHQNPIASMLNREGRYRTTELDVDYVWWIVHSPYRPVRKVELMRHECSPSYSEHHPNVDKAIADRVKIERMTNVSTS